MSSNLKPLKVWGTGGPNPPKVYMILEELGLPHEAVRIAMTDLKKPDYLAINPNGRLPAIYDPNTDLTLWESGAIVEYLIERYDTTNRLSFVAGTKESYIAKQWLFFQTTGQGPYYGQAVWFKRSHPEQLPSAYERYVKEIARVTGVLETHLANQDAGAGGDGPWLVGGKFSYADVAWVPWQTLIIKVIEKDDFDPDGFPHVKEWLGRLNSRKGIRKALDIHEKLQ